MLSKPNTIQCASAFHRGKGTPSYKRNSFIQLEAALVNKTAKNSVPTRKAIRLEELDSGDKELSEGASTISLTSLTSKLGVMGTASSELLKLPKSITEI